MTADALRLDGLRVQASGRTLLDGIDLAIPERGLFGIVGPNGSGKTTLLRAALGLVRPREGRIALLGRALDQWKPAELAQNIGYVAQHGESHWDLTVREMLQLQRPGRAPDPALVARFELDALINRRHASLSGGERARVGVARALAHDPRLLMADEPAAHLDIPHHHRLMALLRDSARTRAVLVVLHDLHVASTWCDRLALLGQGDVEGLPEDHLQAHLPYGLRCLVKLREVERVTSSTTRDTPFGHLWSISFARCSIKQRAVLRRRTNFWYTARQSKKSKS